MHFSLPEFYKQKYLKRSSKKCSRLFVLLTGQFAKNNINQMSYVALSKNMKEFENLSGFSVDKALLSN